MNELKDKVYFINSLLENTVSNIRYSLVINSGLYILKKGKDTQVNNIVLHTTSYSECYKYLSMLSDVVETVCSIK